MREHRLFFRRVALIAVSFFLAPLMAQAALYAPGATLDPACAPTDANCGVESNVASATAGQVPYYATNGNVLVATSTMTILSNGNIGIGTTTPSAKLTIRATGQSASTKLFSLVGDFSQPLVSLFESGAIDIGGVSSTSPANRFTIFSGGKEQLKLLNSGTLRLGAVPSRTNSLYRMTGSTLDVYGTSNFAGALSMGTTSASMSYLASDGTVATTQKIASGTGGFGALVNSDQFGKSVSSIGDLNGDGIPDLAVGAWTDDTGGTDRGAVYILFMNANGTVASSQKIADSTGGFGTLVNSDNFGGAVSSIGDLNGDGIPDLAVGATGDDTGGSARGALYILFMNANGTVASSQKIADSTGGFGTLVNGDNFGKSVFSIGDLNGDGIPDLAVGAILDSTGGSGRGAAYILFMNANGTVASSQKIANSTGGFGVLADGDNFGQSVSSIGDLNGDGIPDLAVGAPNDGTGGSSRGALYILFMNANGTVASSQKIANSTGGFGVLADGDRFGSSVSSMGDLNGDGIPDLTVGARTDSTGGSGRGAVYVLFMNANGTVASSQKIADSTGGFGTLANSDAFGQSVSSIGDLNGDGIPDLSVGATGDSTGGSFRGALYILFMHNTSRLRFSTGASGSGTERLTITSAGLVGIGTSSPDMLLSVGSATPVGNVAHFENSTGSCYINPTTTALVCSSDARLKKNITSLSLITASSTATSTVLDAIEGLRPVTYNWNSEATDTPLHTGFIAQEVQPIFPDLVSQAPDGFLTMNYAGLTPYLVKAVQEIAQKITDFAERIVTKRVETKELCVDGTCITGEQFRAMLNQTGQQGTEQTQQPTDTTSSMDSTSVSSVDETTGQASSQSSPEATAGTASQADTASVI